MAPWSLQGYAVQTLHLVDTNRVRALIPSELEIFSVFPGKTLGAVYLSNYQPGSVLEYSELIVAPAFVKYQGKIGAWVTHIYVDNSDSVAGGREIWGLPKELADFTWLDKRVAVRQGDNTLCTLNFDKKSPAEFEFNIGFIGSKLEVPPESPFASLNLGAPFLSARSDNMILKVEAPQIVGVRAVDYSYN